MDGQRFLFCRVDEEARILLAQCIGRGNTFFERKMMGHKNSDENWQKTEKGGICACKSYLLLPSQFLFYFSAHFLCAFYLLV